MKKFFKIITYILIFTLSGILPVFIYKLSCEDFITMFCAICFSVLFVIPLLVILHEIISSKQYIMALTYLKTLFVSNLIWWSILVFIGIPFSLHYQKLNEENFLQPYKSIIIEIINYKTNHNKYPKTLEEITIPNNIDSEKLDYNTENNGKDFYFSTSKREFETKYIYCTNENLNFYCKPQRTREETIYKIDDGWLKYEHDFI